MQDDFRGLSFDELSLEAARLRASLAEALDELSTAAALQDEMSIGMASVLIGILRAKLDIVNEIIETKARRN